MPRIKLTVEEKAARELAKKQAKIEAARSRAADRQTTWEAAKQQKSTAFWASLSASDAEDLKIGLAGATEPLNDGTDGVRVINQFLHSLQTQLTTYGHLSRNQVTLVTQRVERERELAERAAGWENLEVGDTVEEQLQPGDRHFVIETSDLMRARWESLQLGECVAWVDDDDYVMNNALQRCKEALENTGAGLAFTNESIDDAIVNRQPRFYSDVAFMPSTIHHLCVFRTALVDQSVWEHFEDVGAGLEWLIKGHVALKYGAVHVPIDGYRWTQHPAQHSKTLPWKEGYSKGFKQLQHRLHEYAGNRIDEIIPMYLGK